MVPMFQLRPSTLQLKNLQLFEILSGYTKYIFIKYTHTSEHYVSYRLLKELIRRFLQFRPIIFKPRILSLDLFHVDRTDGYVNTRRGRVPAGKTLTTRPEPHRYALYPDPGKSHSYRSIH